MRTRQWILALAVAAATATTAAIAGECASGYKCDNACPLAQQANGLRSSGREALTAAPSLRAAVAATVERNLSRI